MRNKGVKGEKILQAAKEVFAEIGYHSSSISKIAKRAGVGDGTVYLYFKNKEDILITLFQETISHRFVPEAEAAISYFEDAQLMLYQLVYHHLHFFGQDYNLARFIQIESRQSDPIIREQMRPGITQYFRLIESVVKKGQEQGTFREDISERNARKMIFGTLDEVVTCWVMSTKKYPLLKMVEPTYKLFQQALAKRLPC